jgi:hypothetical protein
MLRVHSTRLFAYVYATVDQPTVSRIPPPAPRAPDRTRISAVSKRSALYIAVSEQTDGLVDVDIVIF